MLSLNLGFKIPNAISITPRRRKNDEKLITKPNEKKHAIKYSMLKIPNMI